MIATWMLQALLVTVLIGLAGRAAEELFRLYSLPRRQVWAAALIAALVVPTWMLVTPAPSPAAADGSGGSGGTAAERLAYGDAQAVGAAAVRIGAGLLDWPGVVAERSSAAASALVAEAVARVGGARLDRALLGAWLVLSLGILSLFGVTMARHAWHRRRWQAAQLADTDVYVAARGGPAVVGVMKPAIVVPSWLLRADPSHQRMVVLHEREHVRAGDHLLVAVAHALAALMPWNLPLYWMLRRLRLTVELDCDRRVLARGAEPRAYGTMLIDIAGRAEGLPLATATLADGHTDLERRILAMTTQRPRLRPVRAGLATALAAALVVVACDVDLTDPALQDATVGEALQLAAENHPTLVPLATDARYFLDGAQVQLDDIGDVQVRELARVEVRKPLVRDGATVPAEVHITSAAAALAMGGQPARVPLMRGQAQEFRVEAARVEAVRGETARGEAVRAQARVEAARVEVRAEEARAEARAAAVRGEASRGEAVRAAAVRGEAVRGEAVRAEAARVGAVRAATAVGGDSVQLRIRGARKLVPTPGDAVKGAATVQDGRTVTLRSAGASTPLYIVDGVIINAGAGLDLDALDIEKIEVIKGAAAVELYGSRAANGVISITTRRPESR
jgi:TonB-dependent SusC/RagA subfamily outer membrane receptor